MPGPTHAARRLRALLAAVILATAAPTSSLAAEPGHPNPSVEMVQLVAGVEGDVVALINSGQTFDGVTFEGIPDGIGLVPVGPQRRGGARYVDVYVTFEQSHVPFGSFADFEDSSVQRARLNLETMQITELDEVLPPSAGFIRFCSAFMAGPEHGFSNYTFLLGEESDDIITVPAGAPYGPDPSVTPYRQGGYSVFLDTETGDYDAIAGLGRINHENNIVVPGKWDDLAILTSDDTFNAPSSQVYLYLADDEQAVRNDDGELWAFRVTATQAGPVDAASPLNDANDYLDISLGQTWRGEFIPVPPNIARGTTGDRPQAALEAWSNANNVFQFVRVEDMAYDPDHPRTVYFTDTGTTRLFEVTDPLDPRRGRLIRLGSGGTNSDGRVFEMTFNKKDPTKVDAFRILADTNLAPAGQAVGFRQPDNIDVGKRSLMLQEDSATGNRIWRYDLEYLTWTHVANVVNSGTSAESSGIVDMSRWLGNGWWALDVQGHQNLPGVQPPITDPPLVYEVPLTTNTLEYRLRREEGQLLLMWIEGS